MIPNASVSTAFVSPQLTSLFQQLHVKSLAEFCSYSAEFLAKRFDEDQLNNLNTILREYLWKAAILPKRMKYLGDCQLPLHILGLPSFLQSQLTNAGIKTITEFIQQNASDHLTADWASRDRLAMRTRVFCLLMLSESQIESLKQPLKLAKFQKIESLGLSIRAYNCLKRAGIETIERLAAMTDDDLLAVRNLGINSLTEIREKLAIHLVQHPFPEQLRSQEVVPAESSETEKVSSPIFPSVNNEIPLSALGLPLRIHNTLIKAGIKTIGQLQAKSHAEIRELKNLGEESVDKIEAKLAAYLKQQSSQPESWDEMPLVISSVSDVESPIDELAKAIKMWLALLSERDLAVISLRYGLRGNEPLTLEQVGQQLGITRERVRQIESKRLKRLKRHLVHYSVRPLNALADDILEQAGRVINEMQLLHFLKGQPKVEDFDLARLIELVFDLRAVCQILCKMVGDRITGLASGFF